MEPEIFSSSICPFSLTLKMVSASSFFINPPKTFPRMGGYGRHSPTSSPVLKSNVVRWMGHEMHGVLAPLFPVFVGNAALSLPSSSGVGAQQGQRLAMT